MPMVASCSPFVLLPMPMLPRPSPEVWCIWFPYPCHLSNVHVALGCLLFASILKPSSINFLACADLPHAGDENQRYVVLRVYHGQHVRRPLHGAAHPALRDIRPRYLGGDVSQARIRCCIRVAVRRVVILPDRCERRVNHTSVVVKWYNRFKKKIMKAERGDSR